MKKRSPKDGEEDCSIKESLRWKRGSTMDEKEDGSIKGSLRWKKIGFTMNRKGDD